MKPAVLMLSGGLEIRHDVATLALTLMSTFDTPLILILGLRLRPRETETESCRHLIQRAVAI